LYIIESEDDLQHIPKHAIPIGSGSNSIINPNIAHPLIKVSPKFCEAQCINNQLTCSAGATVATILKWLIEYEVSAIEFAAGVPATIGGMVYMNFECWGHTISSLVNSVYVFEFNKGCRWISRSEYDVDYRWSSFHDMKCIILAVQLNIVSCRRKVLKQRITDHLRERKEKQPILKSTFGSVFKNPIEKKAWELVEACNLKGMTIGDVKVSTHHANFFENTNKASFKDTMNLIKLIQNKVHTMYNINLECEVQIIQ